MKVVKWLDNYLEEVILVVLLMCMVAIMGVQIAARYIMNASLTWSEELTQYMFVWATFLSISYCVKKRISIKIEQLINVVPEMYKTLMRIVRHTLVFAFCIIMIPYALTYVQQSIEFQATSPALHLPMYFIQSAPLVGFILLAIRVVEAWIREVNNFKNRNKVVEESQAGWLPELPQTPAQRGEVK
ncbi:MAG: TRAP transporter small permease [Eubacterium sp.]|nr:TRAP transporter small permease [Candidatus Colimonas fimequi]